MSAQPVRPRIIDPNMLPGDKNQQVSADPQAAESHQDFTNNDGGEPRGLFTTMYENKMLVIIIILVILIIGMLAYVVLRKKEPEEFTGENENAKGNTHADPAKLAGEKKIAPQQQSASQQQALHQQQMMQQQAMQQQALQQQALHQQQLMQQQAMQKNAQKPQNSAPVATSHSDVVSKYSKDELQKMMEDVGKPDDTAHAPQAAESSEGTDISDYMREAAYADAEKDSKDESFDSAAISVIDKQETLTEDASQICGALTQGGTYCKRKGVIGGRCRTHVGM